MPTITPPKATICSTGRSGSGFIAKVLQAYGISAGHESYFCFSWRDPQSVEIDSSWLATDQLDDYEGVVFHQVRHPLKVLTSLMHTYPNGQRNAEKYFPFRERMMPYRTGDLQRDFMAMIWWMNNEIEKYRQGFYRIEDFNVFHIKSICDHAGFGWDRVKANTAIKSVSSDYNKHHDNDYLTWDDLPDCEETEKLRQQAVRYGY